MKKLISILLAMTMLLALAACGDTPPAADPAPPVEESAPIESEAPVEPEVPAEPEAPAEPAPEEEVPAEPEDPEAGSDMASMTLSEILAAIQADVKDLPGVGDIPLDSENFVYYMFIDPVEGAEALASEAMIGSIAHSLVLLKAPDGADVEAIAQSVRDNANPRKWICVEADDIAAAIKGDLVMFIMIDSQMGLPAADMVDAFSQVAGGVDKTLSK